MYSAEFILSYFKLGTWDCMFPIIPASYGSAMNLYYRQFELTVILTLSDMWEAQ
jgi:hypothetical protein